MTDTRPAECRFRLQDEAKPYPRSNCKACGRGIRTGLGTHCSHGFNSPEWITWKGGNTAPDDWDGGDVLLRNGMVLHQRGQAWVSTSGDAYSAIDWKDYDDDRSIIGYQKRQLPQSDATNQFLAMQQVPPLQIDHVAALLAQGWTKRDDGTLVPPDPLAEVRAMLVEFARDTGLHGLADDLRKGKYCDAVQNFNDALALKLAVV